MIKNAVRIQMLNASSIRHFQNVLTEKDQKFSFFFDEIKECKQLLEN